jgi:magnesium-transporting ATPase (P-type)
MSDKQPLKQDVEAGYGATSPAQGLSQAEAERLLAKYGPNELDAAEKESFLSILLTQAKNVIFLLTTIAAVATWFMGDQIKCYVLLTIVCVVCLCNAIGEYSGQDAGSALKGLTAPKASCLRDGQPREVKSKDLVPGDIVFLKSGEVVPADMHVEESIELRTNESILTGEPHEILKTTVAKDPDANFPTDMVFSATAIVSGQGRARVTSTGMRTQVGLIAKRLKPGDDDKKQDLNPLQKSINALGGVIGVICCVVVVVATGIGYLMRYQNPTSPCPDDDDMCLLLTSIVQGLIMAVSIIPHGLPFVVMVMLRVGSMEMAKQNGLVLKKSAVDYLGATTTICTDKTGTLTEGKMTAVSTIGFVRDGNAPAATKKLAFYPVKGFNPNGGVFPEEQLTEETKQQIEKRFAAGGGGASGAGPRDLAEPGAEGSGARLTQVQMMASFVNCYGTSISQAENGAWKAEGNMSEAALKVAAAKGKLTDTQSGRYYDVYPRLADLEIPFSSKRKMMATVHGIPSGGMFSVLNCGADAKYVAILKGAPDRVLPKLGGGALSETSNGLVISKGGLSPAEKGAIEGENTALAHQALRSLLMVIAPLDDAAFKRLCSAETAEARLDIILSLSVPLSLFGIFDPPRTTVPPSVNECHTAGIQVVMITGDQAPTAGAIGRQVNILHPDDDSEERVQTCSLMYHKPEQRRFLKRQYSVHDERSEIDAHETEYKSPDELDEMTSHVRCWARAQPTDKVAIVDSLTHQGHIVSMTGDGVNDAPALKRASVGVAMGISGTAVAQSASDLILLDDNFSTIVAAIREGRKIYSNVQKYVLFNLSVKGSECTCLLMSIMLDMPMPIQGLQLLGNLIVTHIIPTLALAVERPETWVMKRPPRETKGDWIISRLQWGFRWFPFICVFATCVLTITYLGVWMHVGYTATFQIIGVSRVGMVEANEAACEFSGAPGPDDSFIEDSAPFHCKCMVRDHLWAEPRTVHQWGIPGGGSERLDEIFDPWTGSTGTLYDQKNTPFKDGRRKVLEECKDGKGVNRWCWQKKLAESEKPLLDSSRHCSSWGTMRGQTMGYATIHMGEILALFTYRRDEFSLPWLFTNRIFLGMLVFNLTCLSIFIYVPVVAWALELVPLPFTLLLLVICFALLIANLNELIKVLYRYMLGKENARLEKVAYHRARGELDVHGEESVHNKLPAKNQFNS